MLLSAEERLKMLTSESSASTAWAKLADSEYGLFMLKYFTDRLNTIRKFYRTVPMVEHTTEILAGIQAAEEEVMSVLSKLENSVEHKKAIDCEIQSIVESINVKKDTDRKSNVLIYSKE